MLHVERDAWSVIKGLRQAAHEYPPPCPLFLHHIPSFTVLPSIEYTIGINRLRVVPLFVCSTRVTFCCAVLVDSRFVVCPFLSRLPATDMDRPNNCYARLPKQPPPFMYANVVVLIVHVQQSPSIPSVSVPVTWIQIRGCVVEGPKTDPARLPPATPPFLSPLPSSLSKSPTMAFGSSKRTRRPMFYGTCVPSESRDPGINNFPANLLFLPSFFLFECYRMS